MSLHVVSPGSAPLLRPRDHPEWVRVRRQRTLRTPRRWAPVSPRRSDAPIPRKCSPACGRRPRSQVLLGFPNGQQEFAQTPRIAWGPVVDGLDIPEQPRTLYEDGAFNHVPIMIGSTRDEGWIYADRSYPGGLTTADYQAAVTAEFGASAPAILEQYPAADFPSPKLALSQLAGDVEAVCEVRRVARLIERTGTPVYQYSFEREVPAVAGDQVIHGIDRNFDFGNNYGPPSNYVLNADDLALFRAIAGYWTRFAVTGNPNTDDDSVVHWPAFKHPTGKGRGSDKYLVLDWPVREDKRLREAACDFWEPFFFGSIANGPMPAGG